MGFEVNEISANSKGGTELMRMGLEERLDPALLEDFQIGHYYQLSALFQVYKIKE